MKAKKDKPNAALNILKKYGFGTGMVQGLVAPADQLLLSSALSGIGELLTGNKPNTNNQVFDNINQGGQILAFGGEANPPVKSKFDNLKLPATTIDFNKDPNQDYLMDS